MREGLLVRPIGFVRSPFGEKVEAPRQAVAEGGAGVAGTIELLPSLEHALCDLDGFDRIWVLFWFHQVPEGPSPSKVLPPRSTKKRGVFATRSPHRPNPIGMSAVRLERIEGRVLFIRDLDLVDGTPVLDLKPYVPYADAFPDASAGWVGENARGADPRPAWTVAFSARAEEQLAWLAAAGGTADLRARIEAALALGPQPHPYRRIKPADDGTSVLATKEWRSRFVRDDTVGPSGLRVESIFSGYRPRELERGAGPALDLHRAFVARFG